MTSCLLFFVLATSPDGGAPALPNDGLRVIRTRAEVPGTWSAQVPADFDFDAEMLVVMPGAARARAVTIAKPLGLERLGDDLFIVELTTSVSLPAQAGCDDPHRCSCLRPSLALAELARPRPARALVYRVPKAPGRVRWKRDVVQVTALGSTLPQQCAPCGVPCR